MVFKAYGRRLGGHYIVNVFSAKNENSTYAKLGELVMSEEDYKWFMVKFEAVHIKEAVR